MTEETGFNSGQWQDSLCRNIQTGTENHSPTYSMDTGSPFPPGDEVANAGSYYLPSIQF
jgi:hypothetical protein